MTAATLTADISLAIMALDSGEVPAARAILGAMLDAATAPDTEPVNTATRKQTLFLRNLTGHDMRNWAIDVPTAARMISELLETGRTRTTAYYGGNRDLLTSASGDKYRARLYGKQLIPF